MIVISMGEHSAGWSGRQEVSAQTLHGCSVAPVLLILLIYLCGYMIGQEFADIRVALEFDLEE
jgi:hypothetical protein